MTEAAHNLDDVIDASPAVLADVLRQALSHDADLERAAFRLLEQSITEGDDRRGAWPLLGADALITARSANIVATADDPEPGLSVLFRRCLEKP